MLHLSPVTAELIRAALVGVCAAAPVGPVLLLVIQKSVLRGRIAGMLTGLGSALVDSMYAALAVVALSFAKEFLFRHDAVLMLAGAVLLAFVGYSMYTARVEPVPVQERGGFSLLACPFQAMATALSNPGALILVAGLLGFMGLVSDKVSTPVPYLVIAVFAGEILYWAVVVLVLSGLIRPSREKLGKASRIAGVAVWVFALLLLVRGSLSLLPPM